MASLRLIAIAFISVLTLSLMGCSSDSSNGGGNGNNGKLSPSERWPDTGDFRYNFNENVNGSSCRASDFFYRKADYCIALTNREKNNNCALEARRRTYNTNCGNDFEETNIKGKDWFGYDNRVKESCSTPHVFDNFPTLTAYCDFLKDESQHEYCHWDGRRNEFYRNNCAGAFSPEPGQPVTSPTPVEKVTPTPAPTATPVPTPTPDNRPQVARDLEAAGIKIEIDYNNQIPNNPGEPDFRDSVVQFWKVLENVKGALISRRQFFNEIIVTRYATYDSELRYITLSVNFTEGELLGYLDLVDRRLALQMQLGMPIDLGVEVHSHTPGDKLKDLRETLETLESFTPELKKVKNSMRELKLTDHFYYSFYNRSMTVKKLNLIPDLTKAIKLLQPMNEFFAFTDAQKLEVNFPIGSTDLEIDGPAMTGVMKTLLSSKNTLLRLISLKKLKEISLTKMALETNYYDSLGNLSPATAGPQFEALPDTIDAIATTYVLVKDLGATFSTGVYKVGPNYVKATKRFDKYFNKIKMKKSVKSISYSDKSEMYYSSLVIGANDNDADFEKVLAKIQ